VKCFEYFPQLPPQEISFSSIVVQCASTISENDLYRESMITIFSKRTNKIIYQLRHFFIFSWIDRSVISQGKQKLLFKLLSQMNKGLDRDPRSPILVHCSAGIGRTGTLISIYQIFSEFMKAKKNNKKFVFSVYDTILRLRHMRQFMVQTQGQYVFIYQFIHSFFK
jgi:protein tyrosine phosphatase